MMSRRGGQRPANFQAQDWPHEGFVDKEFYECNGKAGE
jgi:hypothetical protein